MIVSNSLTGFLHCFPLHEIRKQKEVSQQKRDVKKPKKNIREATPSSSHTKQYALITNQQKQNQKWNEKKTRRPFTVAEKPTCTSLKRECS